MTKGDLRFDVFVTIDTEAFAVAFHQFLAQWMTSGSPPPDLPIVHADRFGNDMSTEEALEAILRVYAVGYELPDRI